MNKYTIPWIFMSTLISIPIVFYIIQSYKLKKEGKHTLVPMRKLIASGILTVVGCVGYFIKPIPWWLPPVRAIPFFYSLSLSYSVNVWISTGKQHNLLKSRVFIITVISTIIVVITGFASIDNLGLIITDEDFIITPLYYLHYIVVVCTICYIEIEIIRVFKQSLRTVQSLSYFVRRYTGLMSFRLTLVAQSLMLINLLFYLKTGERYRDGFNNVFYILTPWFGIVPLTNMFPQKILQKILAPFERKLEQKKIYEQNLLEYLHIRVTSIVPKVCLHNEKFVNIRTLIEIGDARDIIFSQKRFYAFITPRKEAQYIYDLLQHKCILNEAGEFPLPKFYGSPRKHSLAVAYHLQRIEARALNQRRIAE